jgi:hypothetical protein
MSFEIGTNSLLAIILVLKRLVENILVEYSVLELESNKGMLCFDTGMSYMKDAERRVSLRFEAGFAVHVI